MQIKYAKLLVAAQAAIQSFGVRWFKHVAYWSPTTPDKVFQYEMGHLPDMTVNGVSRHWETSSDVPYNGIAQTWHSMLPANAMLVVL